MENSEEEALVRQTSDIPSSAKHGSNPQKARLTGLSIEGLKSNISMKKLEKKIDKYNREYSRLKKLAIEVNEGRLAATDSEYEEVKTSISKYNAQAKKLAEIGVQILAFDDDIKKIGMAKDEVARGIKVPSFLVKGLRVLTRAGREKAEEEKKAALEKKALENDMYNRIVDIAKEAVDQDPRGTIDSDKLLNTLNTDNIFAEVKNTVLTDQPEAPVAEETAPPVEEKTASEEVGDKLNIRKGKETISPPDRETEKGPVAPADMVTQLMPGDEEKDDASKKREEVHKGIETVYARRNVSGIDLFKVAKTMSKYKIIDQTDEGKGTPVLVERVIGPGNSQIGISYNDRRFAEKVGAKPSNVSSVFQEALDFCMISGLWRAVVDSSSLPNRDDAFSDDKMQLFNYVVEAVRSGKGRESLIEEISSSDSFSNAEKDVVTRCLGKREYKIFERAIASSQSIDQDFARYLEGASEKMQTEEEIKQQQVAAGIEKRAMKKYGLKGEEKENVEEPKEEVEEEKTEEPEVKENVNVDKLTKLQLELADCIKNRPSSDDPEKLAEYNQHISDLINRINEIARGGLDKEETTKEDTPVKDEVVEVEENKQEEDGRAQLDAWAAKKWAETMSDPSSKEAQDTMLHGRFSDYDVEHMNRVANAALDREAEEARKIAASEHSAQIRSDVEKKRTDIVNRAKAFVLSGMFGDVDYDKALEDISREDGVDVFKEEIEKRRAVDPNGFAWCVDSFVKKVAGSAQGMESSESYNERVCSMAVNDLLNGTSEYDAARIINDMRISQKSKTEEKVEEAPVIPKVVEKAEDQNEVSIDWNKIMSDPDEEKEAKLTVEEDVKEETPVVEAPQDVEVKPVSAPVVSDEVDDAHRDYYDWWSGMLATLDDPNYQEAVKHDVALKEADRRAEEVSRDIEKRNFEENKQARIAEDKASREARFNEVLENGMAEEILAMKGFTVGKEPDDPTAIEILSNVKQNNEDIYNRWIEEYRDYKRQQRESTNSEEVGIKK